jgi:hypothetical protein
MTRGTSPDWPAPEALKAIRAHARNRPPRRLTRIETRNLPLSEIVAHGTPEDIKCARRARYLAVDGWSGRPGLTAYECAAHTWLLQALWKRERGEDVREEIAWFRRREEESHLGDFIGADADRLHIKPDFARMSRRGE